jgi:hypothetical protein
MPTTPDSDFSFDLYPGLDDQLEAALQRNIASGTADPALVATSGLAAAVGNTLSKPSPNSGEELSDEDMEWAAVQLFRASQNWSTYPGLAVPTTNGELLTDSHKRTVERLHEAQKALDSSGEVTPAGVQIGETMRLTLVPWRAFRDHLGDLPSFIGDLRGIQGKASNTADYINDDLLTAIQNGTKMYRNPQKIVGMQAASERWISAEEYLNQRIAQDGDWGIMLAQVSDEAGWEAVKGQSPDQMTADGDGDLAVVRDEVGAMGIFEWLALTLQNDPTKLSSQDYSWLLANRFTDSNGVARVPYGDFSDGQVRSNRRWAYYQGDDVRPRLAVI